MSEDTNPVIRRAKARSALNLQIQALTKLGAACIDSGLSPEVMEATLGEIKEEIDALYDELRSLRQKPIITPPTEDQMNALRDMVKNIGEIVSDNATANEFLKIAGDTASMYKATA